MSSYSSSRISDTIFFTMPYSTQTTHIGLHQHTAHMTVLAIVARRSVGEGVLCVKKTYDESAPLLLELLGDASLGHVHTVLRIHVRVPLTRHTTAHHITHILVLGQTPRTP